VRKAVTILWRLLWCCAAAAVLQAAVRASDVRFEDSAFHNTDWDVVTVSSGSGGYAFSLGEQMPGRPETFRGITLMLSPGPSAICIAHFRRGAVFHPGSQGAIGTVSFRMTVRDSFAQMQSSRFGPAIRQNGRIFVAGPCPWFSGQTNSWTRVALSSLRSFDFQEVTPQGALLSRSARPDFSPHAPPLEFGFAWWAVNPGRQTLLTGGSFHQWAVTLRTARPAALCSVKEDPDGEDVAVGHGVISAAFPDVFYLCSPDRSAGVRVEARGHGLTAGVSAGVVGRLKTNSHGERCIEAWEIYPGGPASVRPLGMRIAWLGGGDARFDPLTGRGQRGVAGGVGLNNIGLLARVAGRVEEVAGGGGRSAILDDGSGRVTVLFPGDGPLPAAGDFVSVTGISSCLSGGGDRPGRALVAVDWEGVEETARALHQP